MLRHWMKSLWGNQIQDKLHELVQTYSDLGRFSGSALVAQHDKVLLSKGYGLANREHEVANTAQSVFRIGSMTKPFTALAIMQLVEAGKLATSDSLSKFMPDFPNSERITLHHLLSNTSGIPDYIMLAEYQCLAKRHVSTGELIDLFRRRPLQFEPGTEFGYSNSGWVLLGAILEMIDGKSYGEVIAQRIFQPCGMTASGYVWEQPVIEGRAHGYVDTGERMLNAELIDETTMHGAGGLYSTVKDLYRWNQALHKGTLLRPATLAQMALPVLPGYGYGWELYQLHNRPVVAHSGGLPGYTSNFARLVEDDAVIILLSNLGNAAWSQLTEGLAAILLGQPYEIPSKQRFIEVDPATLTKYTGEYTITFFGRTNTLVFTLENGKLMMDVRGLPKTVCSALSPTTFYARSKGDVELKFIADEVGQVTTIALNWGGHQLTAQRIK